MKSILFNRFFLSGAVVLSCLGIGTISGKQKKDETAWLVSRNPSENYQVLGRIKSSTHAEVDAKLAKAHAAFSEWSALSMEDRVAHLERVYQSLSAKRQEISTMVAQEMGMPISLSMRIDVDAGLMYLRGYLDNAPKWLAPEITFSNETEEHVLSFEARGVAGVSVAWNYPFCNFIWGVMQNLVVGNTVVFKHSEECPLTAQLLEELMQQADLPEGVFAMVYGTGRDIGEYLMNGDIDILHFTGSTKVGKHLYRVAARSFIPAILELGGSAAGIVCADATIADAVESIYANRFMNSGQICDGLKRLIVHKDCYEQLLEELKQCVASKRVGNALDPLTDIGPLVSERQVRALEDQVADAVAHGATVVVGGKRPDGLAGAYYEPTLLTGVTSEMRVWREEVFGPVLSIVAFSTEAEVLAYANDTIYGLGGYIYTSDAEQAQRLARNLKTGNISINGADYVLAESPFGGYKCSGMGREHGKMGLQQLCNAKLVARKK